MESQRNDPRFSVLLALFATMKAIVSNLGADPGPVIGWGAVIAAALSIGWALKNYPPYRLLTWTVNFYHAQRIAVLRGVAIVLFTVGAGLLSLSLFSPQPAEVEAAFLPTNTAPSKLTVWPSSTPSPSMTPSTTPSPTAMPTNTPAPAAHPTPRYHVVERNQNLWCIAEKYYGRQNGHLYTFICRANQANGQIGDSCDELQVGEKLVIPTKQDYPWAPIPDPLPTPGVADVDYFCHDAVK